MKSVNQKSNGKSFKQNPQNNYSHQSDYSVHYENDLTKIKIKKVYNIEEECKSDQSLEGFIPKIIENSEIVNISEQKIEPINDANSDNKRRRSANLNSSNEENSPKICQEKKKSKIEQRQKMFEVCYFRDFTRENVFND